MKSKYKYDELGYAETIYKDGFQTNHIQTELNLLAAYAKHVLEMKPARRKQFIYEFCGKHLDGFRRELWFKQINRALDYSNKKQSVLSRITHIEVTRGELDYILSLDVSHDCHKIFFAFLIHTKLNKSVYEFKNGKPYDSTFFRGDKSKYNLVKKMANVPSAIDINGEFVHQMYKAGLIDVLFNGLIRHKWMEDCLPSGDVVIEVRDFENVGLYLDYHLGVKGVKLCGYCGQPFVVSRNDRLYCKEHKDYHPKIGDKTVTCVDCGALFDVDSRNMTKVRCDTCQKKHRQQLDRERKKCSNSAGVLQ